MKKNKTNNCFNFCKKTLFKYIIIYLIGILVLLYFSENIEVFVRRYLTTNFQVLPDKFQLIFKITSLALFILCLSYLIFKLYFKKYKISSSFKHSVIVGLLVYIVLRVLFLFESITFLTLCEIGNHEVYYIDLIAILLLVSVFSLLLNFKNGKTPHALLQSDDPIENNEGDKFNFKNKIEHLSGIIEKSHFEKSFSIGIVGSWGSGKSSFINLLKEKVEKNNDLLYLEFFPFMAQKDSDMYSLFFDELISLINKYDGRLSDDLLSYINRLLESYHNKTIISLFSKKNTLQSNVSISKLYKTINDSLFKLDKKIIVFVEDLDRLTAEEVVQVLKLIRNSANFRNFIFIVSLDKEYILRSLMTNNHIYDYSYINKFFQLEVHLKKISQNNLKKEFKEILTSIPLEILPDNIKDEIISLTYNQRNLFDDYIFTMRDVKRLVNQIIFDYPLLKDDIDINDYLNFTYLKINFPSVVEKIHKFKSEIFEIKDQCYSLQKINEELSEKTSKEPNFTVVEFDITNDYWDDLDSRTEPEFSKYKLYDEYITNKKSSANLLFDKNYTALQNRLMFKTIIYLFGDEFSEYEDKVSYKSIRYGQNLRMLLTMSLGDKMSNKEFNNIFNNDITSWKEVIDEESYKEITSRISYKTPMTTEEYKTELELLLFIFNSSVTNPKMNIYDVWEEIEAKLTMEFMSSDELGEFLKDYIKTPKESYSSSIALLYFISSNKDKINFKSWNLTNEEFDELIISNFELYLNNPKQIEWFKSGFNFHQVYFHCKNMISNLSLINKLCIDFFKKDKNSFKKFIALSLKPWPYGYTRFKSSRIILSVFGFADTYYNFLNTEYSDDVGIKEYIEFYKLGMITGSTKHILFDFKNFKEVKERIEKLKEANKTLQRMTERDKKVQVVFKVAKHNFREDSYIKYIAYPYKDDVFVFFYLESNQYHKNLASKVKDMQNDFIPSNVGEIKIENENIIALIENKEEVLAQIYSVQPSDYK